VNVNVQRGSVFRGTFDFQAPDFDWEGVKSPGHPLHDLIIYEVPVRTFTASPSSKVPEQDRGTFQGLASKAPYLKSLGINAVELLPVFEYDELEFQRSKNKRDHMVNVWGYSHIVFFAPMSRFASGGGGAAAAAHEFKTMVKEYVPCHAAGHCVALNLRTCSKGYTVMRSCDEVKATVDEMTLSFHPLWHSSTSFVCSTAFMPWVGWDFKLCITALCNILRNAHNQR
jgi:hypothetical protein